MVRPEKISKQNGRLGESGHEALAKIVGLEVHNMLVVKSLGAYIHATKFLKVLTSLGSSM